MQGIYSIITSLILNLTIGGCTSPSNQTALVNSLPQLEQGNEIATFAGGCFWCTEAVFERVEGVTDVVSGYTGGEEKNPTYKAVSYGETTHAEAIQIYYDPKVISYERLLEIFFVTHDPTQVNGQGPDVGTQYRTEVYYHDNEQKAQAEKYIAKLNSEGKYEKKIATKVTEYDEFWLAEEYHQNYYELNRGNPYIVNIAVPKVKKLKKYFPEVIKDKYKGEK
ncbi:MAG: peptide-methionine (S)-S-oxide reductase [Roseivirga sp.]|jgi:peptide-methionine (S)-S-oxide reductase